ncbi:MAG: RusA family crossover junction endodeoxyribonuclease [Muribaculaceae bacterium]|nr:RusA family crossover junction endodeoxyribonuclease [Muribaculaceae bacterium]
MKTDNKAYARQTILGQPPSKSNTYRIIELYGRRTLGKTPALERYEMDFFRQCSLRGAGISRRFRLTVDVFFGSDRPDLDNSLKVILDCLQACRAIKNDRLCSEIHARKFTDKKNPRIEFAIEELI